MNGEGGVTGSALLEELREALLEFKQRQVHQCAYNETYSGQYYLASVADKIHLQPEGGWTGRGSLNVMFYKGLLDKLNLRAEVFRPTACKYKAPSSLYPRQNVVRKPRADADAGELDVGEPYRVPSASSAHRFGEDAAHYRQSAGDASEEASSMDSSTVWSTRTRWRMSSPNSGFPTTMPSLALGDYARRSAPI